MGDYPKATAVFDVDSVGLLRIIKVTSQARNRLPVLLTIFNKLA